MKFVAPLTSGITGRHCIKVFSDLNVILVQPRNMNFLDRITFIWLNFIILYAAQIKNVFIHFFDVLERNKRLNK